MSDVAAVMGDPDDSLEKSGGEVVWYYGASAVTFRKDRVLEWVNFSENLKTRGEGEARLASADPARERGDGSLWAPAGLVGAGGTSSLRGSGATNPSIQYVEGHARSDGRQVQGYYRTRGDTSRTNNFSSRGNVNPMTGRRGYR